MKKGCNCVCHFDPKSATQIVDGGILGCKTCYWTGQGIENIRYPYKIDPRDITRFCKEKKS